MDVISRFAHSVGLYRQFTHNSKATRLKNLLPKRKIIKKLPDKVR